MKSNLARVLVIEKPGTSMEGTAYALRFAGWVVARADTPTALELMAKGSYQVVLADAADPQLRDLLEAIKSSNPPGDLLVTMTAETEGRAQAAVSAGAYCTIHLPITDPTILASVIGLVLRKQQLDQASIALKGM